MPQREDSMHVLHSLKCICSGLAVGRPVMDVHSGVCREEKFSRIIRSVALCLPEESESS
jgi:hypothetical protein